MAWQRTRIELPETLKPSQRVEAAELIIEYIRERTRQGTGIRDNGRLYDFPSYTKEYRAFKGSSKVDLTLSSEMLDELKILSIQKGSVNIGYENGSRANDKAEGNILGSYGGSPNSRKARSFLGVNRAELKAILAGFEE